MFIDSHAHLTDPQFSKDLEEVLSDATANGVEKIICVATNLKDSGKAIDLAKKYEDVYASVGIYPDENFPKGDFRPKLVKLAKNKKVVAIGECGLDYAREGGKNDSKTQKELLRMQIGTAIQLDLPLIIHNRNADKDILEELSRYSSTGKLKGVFHCFTSPDKDFAKKVLDLNFYISFSAIITYPSASSLIEVIKYIPEDKILIETDSPFLSPQNLRGRRNTPSCVKIMAERLADILDMTLENVAKLTSNNTKELFKFG